jgi:hypothetical protein
MKQIKTLKDYYFAMAEIETYLKKGFDSPTPMEEKELEKLSEKISEYEKVHFPMPQNKV